MRPAFSNAKSPTALQCLFRAPLQCHCLDDPISRGFYGFACTDTLPDIVIGSYRVEGHGVEHRCFILHLKVRNRQLRKGISKSWASLDSMFDLNTARLDETRRSRTA